MLFEQPKTCCGYARQIILAPSRFCCWLSNVFPKIPPFPHPSFVWHKYKYRAQCPIHAEIARNQWQNGISVLQLRCACVMCVRFFELACFDENGNYISANSRTHYTCWLSAVVHLLIVRSWYWQRTAAENRLNSLMAERDTLLQMQTKPRYTIAHFASGRGDLKHSVILLSMIACAPVADQLKSRCLNVSNVAVDEQNIGT